MLLNTISEFLLAENVLLPDSLIKESVQKVTRNAAYARNPRLQIPQSRVISGHSVSGWERRCEVPFSLFTQIMEKLPNALNKVWWVLGFLDNFTQAVSIEMPPWQTSLQWNPGSDLNPTASVEKGRRTVKKYILTMVIKQIIESNLVKKKHCFQTFNEHALALWTGFTQVPLWFREYRVQGLFQLLPLLLEHWYY